MKRKQKLFNLKTLLLLSTIALTGCTENDKVYDYEMLSQCKLIALKNNDSNTIEYYLANEIINGENSRFLYDEFYNIFDDRNIYYEYYDDEILFEKPDNKELIEKIDVKEYLKETNNTKEKYTQKELSTMMDNMIKENEPHKKLILKKS